jgi:hypothetical protein
MMRKLMSKRRMSLKKEKAAANRMMKYSKVLEFTRKCKKNSRLRRKPKKK